MASLLPLRAWTTALAGAFSRPRSGQTDAARSMHYLVWVGILFACVAFAAVTVVITLQARERALDSARASVQNTALVLDQHTDRIVETIDLLLRTVLHSGNGHGSKTNVDAGRFTSFVENLAKEQAHVASVALLDPETGVDTSFLGETSAAATAVNADAYRAFRTDPDPRIHIGPPVFDEGSRTWLIGISGHSSPSRHDHGRIAVAHVDLGYIQSLYEEIEVGRHGSIGLWRSDGVLLARKPYKPDDAGRKFPNATLLEKLKEAPSGTYETVSAVDGVSRIIGYRRLQDVPLVITVSLSRDEVLAAWWKDALTNLALIPIILLIVCAFGALIGREARNRDQAEIQLRQKSELLEATLDNMDQGLIMVDDDARVRICNRRFLELLDLPAELMATHPRTADILRYQFAKGEFIHMDPPSQDWMMTNALERRYQTYERQRPNGIVLEIRTVPVASGGAVRTFTDITERKQSEERITHMARHDALTDLPNRLLFRERLEQALAHARRRSEGLALLCLDLDEFKAVNDTLGHPVGDSLLEAVAHRIRAGVREGDTVARLGGDEFAILQLCTEQPEDTTGLARRLIEAMSQPFQINGHTLNISVSIGIATAPGDGLDPDELFKNADLALYRAKADGRGTFRFFEPEMDAHVRARRALEIDLREALAKGEFTLSYQPFLNLARNEIVGFEALLRWTHPTRGPVSPAEFIPIAEETGLIVPLGEWVLRQACVEAVRWLPGKGLAVNISAAQFRSPNLVQTVVSALSGSGLAPELLELEITETSLMQNNEASVRTLHQLRSLGVRIAMDDFGTGYSSLSYLHSFPFDKLKIDRSFVQAMMDNPECAAIVRTIVRLGDSLGITTIAEGVETPEQLEAVRAQGCTEIQGYLISTPKPVAEAARLVPPKRTIAAA